MLNRVKLPRASEALRRPGTYVEEETCILSRVFTKRQENPIYRALRTSYPCLQLQKSIRCFEFSRRPFKHLTRRSLVNSIQLRHLLRKTSYLYRQPTVPKRNYCLPRNCTISFEFFFPPHPVPDVWIAPNRFKSRKKLYGPPTTRAAPLLPLGSQEAWTATPACHTSNHRVVALWVPTGFGAMTNLQGLPAVSSCQHHWLLNR